MSENQERLVCPYCYETEGTLEEIWRCSCVGATRAREQAALEDSADWKWKERKKPV